jgi:phosphoribosylamine--glycine ligase
MKVLLLGSGGREHALAWKIAQSPTLTKLYIAPGNPGTAQFGTNVPVDSTNIPLLLHVAREQEIDLLVVGPEAPLAAGVADAFIKAGIPVFGPTQAAAQLESSKAFAKELMRRANVPTAQAHMFENPEEAVDFARRSKQAWVVKADGLASGKGVIVAEDVEATVTAIEQLAATGAGQLLLLEERLRGPEVSVIALCDGTNLLPLPPAQDHKRLLDGNHGPNTGGMGAYAPAPHIALDDLQTIAAQVMVPVVNELMNQGTPFRGALYAGLMLTAEGPRVLEFNARFGDPETQAILPLIEGDFLAVLRDCAVGQMRSDVLQWRRGAAACVVLASAGYPESPRKGDDIQGLEAVEEPNTLVFHAGTEWDSGTMRTQGGRVLGVTGIGGSLDEALDHAYEAIDVIHFEGMQYRRDIGRA